MPQRILAWTVVLEPVGHGEDVRCPTFQERIATALQCLAGLRAELATQLRAEQKIAAFGPTYQEIMVPVPE